MSDLPDLTAPISEPSDPSTKPVVPVVEGSRMAYDHKVAEIERRFGYHPPVSQAQADLLGRIRIKAMDFARFIAFVTPPGREQSMALTSAEDAQRYTIAALVNYTENGVRADFRPPKTAPK